MSADPFAATPDAVACETPIERRPRRRKALIDKLGTTEKPAKKKKTDLNPFQRRWFERNGWVAGRVDRANPWGGVTQDFWGVADWLGAHAEHGAMLVQTCHKDSIATRCRKIESVTGMEVVTWCTKNRFEVHGFYKEGNRWQVKRVQLLWVDGKWIRQEIIE